MTKVINYLREAIFPSLDLVELNKDQGFLAERV